MSRTDRGPQPQAETARRTDSSDADLLAAYRRGDRAAAEELVERTYRQIYASLFRLCGGDGDLAADLTQEAYRRAWQALPGFEGRSRFATWLYRIAYTTFLNHIRRPQRLQPLDEQQAERLPDPAPPPSEQIQSVILDRRLRRHVLALDEPLRDVVAARYWGELTLREIARLEGVTAPAIQKRITKALRLLAERLAEDN